MPRDEDSEAEDLLVPLVEHDSLNLLVPMPMDETGLIAWVGVGDDNLCSRLVLRALPLKHRKQSILEVEPKKTEINNGGDETNQSTDNGLGR